MLESRERWSYSRFGFFGRVLGQHAVQNAVDELGRLPCTEALGQLDGLVDGYAIGRVRVQDLERPYAEDVPIGGRHTAERPIVCRTGKQLVQFGPVSTDFSKSQRDSFDTINVRLGFESDMWSATLWGRNVTNERYLEEVIPAPEFGGSFLHQAAGSSYGVDFKLRF